MKKKEIELNYLINEYNKLKSTVSEFDLYTDVKSLEKYNRFAYLLFGLSAFEVYEGLSNESLALFMLAFGTAFIGVITKASINKMGPPAGLNILKQLDNQLEEIRNLKKDILLDEKIVFENTNLQRIRK